jgi:hypothetical protein
MSRGSLGLRTVWGAVVVYLALGVPAARIWHEATANHRYCPEHRAMEEAPDASAARHSGAPTAPSAPSRGEQHETCAFTPLGGQTTLAPVQAALRRPAPCLENPVRLRILGRAGRLISVLSLAPKTSPPA